MLTVDLVQTLMSGVIGLFPDAPPGVSDFLTSLVADLPAIAVSGPAAEAFVSQQMAVIKTMIDEQRGPSQAEWDALNAEVQSQMNALAEHQSNKNA